MKRLTHFLYATNPSPVPPLSGGRGQLAAYISRLPAIPRLLPFPSPGVLPETGLLELALFLGWSLEKEWERLLPSSSPLLPLLLLLLLCTFQPSLPSLSPSLPPPLPFPIPFPFVLFPLKLLTLVFTRLLSQQHSWNPSLLCHLLLPPNSLP